MSALQQLKLELSAYAIIGAVLAWAAYGDLEAKAKAAESSAQCRTHGGVPLVTSDKQQFCLRGKA